MAERITAVREVGVFRDVPQYSRLAFVTSTEEPEAPLEIGPSFIKYGDGVLPEGSVYGFNRLSDVTPLTPVVVLGVAASVQCPSSWWLPWRRLKERTIVRILTERPDGLPLPSPAWDDTLGCYHRRGFDRAIQRLQQAGLIAVTGPESAPVAVITAHGLHCAAGFGVQPPARR